MQTPTPVLTGPIRGVYFDGRSSRDHDAILHVTQDQVRLEILTPNAQSSPGSRSYGVQRPASQQFWELQELKIEPAMSRIRRVVKLPDGGRFETADDPAVGQLELLLGRNAGLRQVRRIEANWTLTLGALLGLGVFVWGFLTYGLPAVARSAALATPRSVLQAFDNSAVELLDDGSFMGPSGLSARRQREIQAEFRQVVAWEGSDYPYQLLLRSGEPSEEEAGGFPIGANAFALPGGTIVMTDQLVALAQDDRELLGVLAHELGHVRYRHSLTSVYQGLGITLLITAVTGDFVSAGTFAASVPTALLKNGYSRQAETQSDELAGQYMMQEHGTTKPLRDVLARLERDDKKADENDIKPADDRGTLLQTHPGTAARIEHLRQIEQMSGKAAAPARP